MRYISPDSDSDREKRKKRKPPSKKLKPRFSFAWNQRGDSPLWYIFVH
jgi:hypothetical protein